MRLRQNPVIAISVATFIDGYRDRLIQGLLIVGVFFVLSTAVFSSFSMRQPMEVAINYGLSVVQILATILTLFLGLNLISRELESKAGHPVLAQPISRGSYIIGKFMGLLMIVLVILIISGACAALGIWLTTLTLDTPGHVSWAGFIIALYGTFISCTVLGGLTVLFTSLSTSAILPFLLTCGVYAIGQSTQAAKRFIEAELAGVELTPLVKMIAKGAYYIFPNFALFDFKVQAIYDLPESATLLGIATVYGLTYLALTLFGAVILFEKRDLS